MREVKVGKKYRHFKGMEVLVECIAKDSETQEKMVVYKHLKDGVYWVRPHDIFISRVDHQKYPDVKATYRFEEIEE